MIITFQEIVENCLHNHFNFNHTAYIRGSRGSKPPPRKFQTFQMQIGQVNLHKIIPRLLPPPTRKFSGSAHGLRLGVLTCDRPSIRGSLFYV